MLRNHLRSNVVGYLALFVALSGTAVALPATGTVFSDDIVNGEVRSKDISDTNGVRSADVRDDDKSGGGLAAIDLDRNSVGGSEIATDGVGSPEVASDAVRGREIATDGVGSPEIELDAVRKPEIATDGVGSLEIAGNAVGASEIGLGAVGAAEIATDSVGSAEILQNAVGASEIGTDSVGKDAIEVADRAGFVVNALLFPYLNNAIRMLEQGRECEDVVTQLAAVSKALDRAGFAIVATGLKQCLAQEGDAQSLDTKKMEKLFLSLA